MQSTAGISKVQRSFRTIGRFICTVWLLGAASRSYALNPAKALSQYSITVWSQQQGLPQDTVRAIAQTPDGFLWLGTDEGLARFDGYEFLAFGKDHGDLPSNSVNVLAAGADGALWIGTSNGLTRYAQGRFRTFTEKDGLPRNPITALLVDHAGHLWIVAAGNLSRFDGSHFTNFYAERDIPLRVVRGVWEDRSGLLYVAGTSSVVRLENGRFRGIFEPSVLANDFPGAVLKDHRGSLWILGYRGLVRQTPDGRISRFGAREGLTDPFELRDVKEDRDGNLWVATNSGLARLEGSRFRILTEGTSQDGVRCVFEDRDGNLWVGANRGLLRLRDDVFTVFGKDEGLPSDEPNAIHEDHDGSVWVGFLDAGLRKLSPGDPFHVLSADPEKGRIYSIRETRTGALLVCSREGLEIREQGSVRTFVPPDPQGRKRVFDALQDSSGRIWLALPNGLGQLNGNEFRTVIPAANPSMLEGAFVTLTEASDRSLWAGTIEGGLWHIAPAGTRLYTVADGLGSNQIRSLYSDRIGTLWAGTFGGGLNAFLGGRFHSFTERDGLLSDNISQIGDDGDALWLSTTRGICRISKKQLIDFASGGRSHLDPINYGLADGLRSAQPPADIGLGGGRHSDSSVWFATARGIAVYKPTNSSSRTGSLPIYIADFTADGQRFDASSHPRIPPGRGRVEIRYAAIDLSAPDRLDYSYKLDGLDSDWISAGKRRVATYNSLGHGHYRFRVRAAAPGVPPSEAAYDLELLPHYYETGWFRGLCAAFAAFLCWMAYQLRVRQIRLRFAAVLKERLRLAREIHDTLAQAFVGISSQLDALETCLPEHLRPAHIYLDLARRMAQHSLTEARRSVMDLRSAALSDRDLAAALQSNARHWAAGGDVNVEVHVDGGFEDLPEEMEHNLLRIAQEAITNASKHAQATKIEVKLERTERTLNLTVIDDGCGFQIDDAFATMGGHFGLIGIRERAERIGGELRLESRPDAGTEVEISVPLP
ncbi:MAG TPA: two-component regulator propeller domain-containing protein [Bryobacteraceae bacterium]|nr:two-component regulator propeller domain-containing protein [Bryobacteraceae bacterium]